MLSVAPWQPLDESYWNAIVSQGQWVEHTYSSEELVLSTQGLDYRCGAEEVEQKWERLNSLFHEGTIICLPVIGYNKGGLLVEWEALQGFVPTSQLLNVPLLADDCARMDGLATHVGQTLNLKIIELEREQNRIIFSERAAGWGKCCPDALLMTLRSGDICEGHVSNLCHFGVFVDLGGVDGLIHVSELSWQRVNHPRDILRIGQRLKVYVIDVDHERRRIALSLKRLEANPWQTVAQRYRPGMVVKGLITNLVEFGAFACIEEGVEGLIHISELSAQNEELKLGEHLYTRILSVDAENQRMALSLRGVEVDAHGTSSRI